MGSSCTCGGTKSWPPPAAAAAALNPLSYADNISGALGRTHQPRSDVAPRTYLQTPPCAAREGCHASSVGWCGGGGGWANYHIKRRQNALCINSAGTINGFSLATAMHSGCNPVSTFSSCEENARVRVKTPFALCETSLKKSRARALSRALPKKHLVLATWWQRTFPGSFSRLHAGRVSIRFAQKFRDIFKVLIRARSSNDILTVSRYGAGGVFSSRAVAFHEAWRGPFGIFAGLFPLRQLHGPMLLAVECQL